VPGVNRMKRDRRAAEATRPKGGGRMTGGTAGAKTALVPDMHEGMFGTGAFLTFRQK